MKQKRNAHVHLSDDDDIADDSDFDANYAPLCDSSSYSDIKLQSLREGNKNGQGKGVIP